MGDEKDRLLQFHGLAMAETKIRKWGQMEVIGVEKFLSTRAPDQCHRATEIHPPSRPQACHTSPALAHGNSSWDGVKSAMETVV